MKVYQFKGFPQVNLYNVKLNIPGDTLVQEDKFILRASIINGLNTADYKKIRKPLKFNILIMTSLRGGINIRKREGGDIIKPVNSNGTKKLKSILLMKNTDRYKEPHSTCGKRQGNSVDYRICYK